MLESMFGDLSMWFMCLGGIFVLRLCVCKFYFSSGGDNTAENFVYVLRPHNVWGADGKQEFISWLKHFRGTKEMPLCFVKYIYMKITSLRTDNFPRTNIRSYCDQYLCPMKRNSIFFLNIQKNPIRLTNFFVSIYRKQEKNVCMCVCERFDGCIMCYTNRPSALPAFADHESGIRS